MAPPIGGDQQDVGVKHLMAERRRRKSRPFFLFWRSPSFVRLQIRLYRLDGGCFVPPRRLIYGAGRSATRTLTDRPTPRPTGAQPEGGVGADRWEVI